MASTFHFLHKSAVCMLTYIAYIMYVFILFK